MWRSTTSFHVVPIVMSAVGTINVSSGTSRSHVAWNTIIHLHDKSDAFLRINMHARTWSLLSIFNIAVAWVVSLL